MSAPGPILDYASPRSRGVVRLPAESTLTILPEDDGVTVIERLRGKPSAIMAIAFAGIVLAALTAGVITSYLQHQAHPHREPLVQVILLAAFGVTELVLLILVIHQTWRSTRLAVRGERVTLRFRSPFHVRQYRWHRDDVLAPLVSMTQAGIDAVALAEIELRAEERLIRLFTDHREPQVRQVAQALTDALATER